VPAGERKGGVEGPTTASEAARWESLVRHCPVLKASQGILGARKLRTCQLPARMRVPSPAIWSLRSLYAAYGLVLASVATHKPKIVKNEGGCVPEGPQHRKCAEWKARAVWPEWWPKTPSASCSALLWHIRKWVRRPTGRRSGARGGTHPSAWRALHGGWGLVARQSQCETCPYPRDTCIQQFRDGA
jgi:hypothetical protein